MSDLIQRAKAFATVAHGFQRRKYTGEPYIVHPEAVAALVEGVPHTEEMVAAAWLHDVVEDRCVAEREICSAFGFEVAILVWWLTDVSLSTHGTRAARKAIDRQHIAKAWSEAKTIKLADLIDNSKSIIQHDKEFARVYLREKQALLGVLRDGDPTLYEMASAQVQAGLLELGLAVDPTMPTV